MRIVLLGAPGSGKGTQAQKLMAQRGVPQISTGDLLRAAVAAGSDLGRRAKAAMDAGELVSDEIVLGILRERLAGGVASSGFILDGFPRNRAQAQALEEMLAALNLPLTRVALMHVDFDLLHKRITGRRTCSANGKVLNVHFSSPAELEDCVARGGTLVQRDDDREETIANRLRVYRAQTEPLIDYYKERALLRVVDADAPVDEVYRRLLLAIDGV